MDYAPENPMIVQGDQSVLLEVQNKHYEAARDILARFAELEKSPEYVHTYRITPLSLWNAAASGLDANAMLAGLEAYSKYPIPDHVRIDMVETVGRYGRVKLILQDGRLLLTSEDRAVLTEVEHHKELTPYIIARIDAHTLRVDTARRGHVKQALVKIGYPVEDLAGYIDGEALAFVLRANTFSGDQFDVRPYQREAAARFYAGGAAHGGSGVIVLPCGAGKTIVGMAVMADMQTNTLILTPNTASLHQWINELLDKTTLTEDQIGEYSGQQKVIRPITVSTYQTMTYAKRGVKADTTSILTRHPHFALFHERNWGLIIYDEVHLLPAPVFSITADLQARRRLGLTATLVREDGRERDVFSLIGPKKDDVPWKDLERQGWIAQAHVVEIRIPLPDVMRLEYAVTELRQQYRAAAENPAKFDVLDHLLNKHADDQVLIIGMYLEQLEQVEKRYGYPIITGKTAVKKREQLYDAFRRGNIKCLILSKVGNFAIDLPDASVMMQISGTFGSRQEEAQRLGRILRPKTNGQAAHFYTLVTKDTIDQEYGARRQLYLTEQGYRYTILYDDEVASYDPSHAASAHEP